MAQPEHEPHCTNGNSNINSRYCRLKVRHYYSTFRCLARCNGNRPCWRRRIRRGPYGSCTGEHALRSDRERGGRIRPFRHNGEFDCLGTFCRSACYWTATVGTCRGVVDTRFIQLLKVVLPHTHIHTHTHARHATPRNVIPRLFQLLTAVLYIYIYIYTAYRATPRSRHGTLECNALQAAHCDRGDEIILGHGQHIFKYEGGGASALLGVAYHTIPNLDDGTMRLDDIRAAARPDDQHYPRTY